MVDKTKEAGRQNLAQSTIWRYEVHYSKILFEGREQLPQPPPAAEKKPGKKKRSKPENLLDRLFHFRNETLAFMYDFRVPFDNNQGERDVRMMKV